MPNLIDRAIGLLSIKPPGVRVSPYTEAGVSGTAVYGGYVANKERTPGLWGQERYRKASDILANMSIVAAGVRYFLNLVAKPEWVVEPASDKAEHREIAEFVHSVLHDMDTSWPRIVRRGGMFKYHGFGVQEWVAKKRADGRIGFADIEQRPQHTIERWSVDARGTVEGVMQRSPQTGAEFWLPRSKIIYLVDDTLTDSPEGMGWFRHLVDPSNRLERYLKLEGLGYERDLSGIPIGRAPLAQLNAMVGSPKPGGGVYSESDVRGYVQGLQQFVTQEVKDHNTGLILDSSTYMDQTDNGTRTSAVAKWGLELLTGSAESIEYLGKAIERVNFEMARIIGVENILTGSDGKGSLALSKDKSQNLWMNVNSTTQDMAAQYTRDIVDPIAALNGIPDEDKPKLKCPDVSFRDAEAAAAVLRDLSAAGAILMPDDPAIDDIRDLVGIARQPEMTPERMGMLTNVVTGGNPDPNADPEAGGGGRDEDDPAEDQDDVEGARRDKGKAKGGAARKAYNPNQPRDPGGEGGGQWVSGGGSDDGGSVKTWGPESRAELVAEQVGKPLDELHQAAIENQEQLGQIGEKLSKETGLEFINPGPKTLESAQRKLDTEGYSDAGQLTDLSRGTFVVDSPAQADQVVKRLSSEADVYDRGWQKLPQSGYLDRKVMLRFKNGGVAEVQLVPRGVQSIKSGDGHKLYETARNVASDPGIRAAANSRARDLYAGAIDGTEFSTIY